MTPNRSELVRKIPPGYTAAMPWIIGRDTVKLLDFVKRAFNAEELGRVPNDDGTIGHAEFKIGDTILLAFDARDDWPETPAFIRLYADDGDAVFQQALAAGATAVTRMTKLAFGDRVGRVCDPLGNIWWIQERLEDPSDEEMARRFQDPAAMEAMRYVQESLGDELRRRKRGQGGTP